MLLLLLFLVYLCLNHSFLLHFSHPAHIIHQKLLKTSTSEPKLRPSTNTDDSSDLHSCLQGRSSSSLFASTAVPSAKGDSSISNINKLYYRASWISWWIQIILSVIGGTILTFANTVRQNQALQSQSGFALSTISVIISLFNSMWTWNFTRIGRRVQTKKIQPNNVVPTLRKLSRISVAISILGLGFSLIAAELIAGTLASKALTTQVVSGSLTFSSNANSLQALDIFLVQANTNVLVSHYAPLVCYTLLQTQLPFPDRNVTRTIASEIIDKPLERDE
jgi:hypothetical protein